MGTVVDSEGTTTETEGDRTWVPMALEYVGHVGDVMKATHKSGQFGEGDPFTNKKPTH
jgi:hypothetical protein